MGGANTPFLALNLISASLSQFVREWVYIIRHFYTLLLLQALAPTNEPLLLFIRATDGRDHGTPDPQLEIRVFLRDINDNSPQFTNLPRTVTFPEVCSPDCHST